MSAANVKESRHGRAVIVELNWRHNLLGDTTNECLVIGKSRNIYLS